MTKGETYDVLEEHVRHFVMRQNAAIVRRATRNDHVGSTFRCAMLVADAQQ
ncbi:hypothetical protein OG883_45325 [Streptomyces sp. NBC_01142]|uniref:hypothetical protein n=1 Tax=Streptomyces sp. NBC_01142 TaxID=2975865 RepID=UPI002250A60F|nr:hypothetical protein [Streptomyces sp. NBC_01142]MCX4826862.1 hypothetical protein [Streptomyces sp. NBC_01142]